MVYEVDPLKRSIADSWPDAMDDSCARKEWNWQPVYNLEYDGGHVAQLTKQTIETVTVRFRENENNSRSCSLLVRFV